ncbi:redoxin domain-containing protein [Porphyromonas pogonae]|uniref:redoxin domain-containing protein n=1 Tax=Porphyromonas pogonae TaxID=867595 RepID=UPI002E77E735|nr:redoxin domain-containing protein [Porphyromonas pogonae]
MRLSKHILPIMVGAVIFTGCKNNGRNKFVVEGSVTDAAGQMLFLDEVGTGNVVSLDSVKLDENGAFTFTHEGTYYPMFYRLRLNRSSIPFAADSATHLVLKASGKDFFGGYDWTDADSENRQIRDISHQRYSTDMEIDEALADFHAGKMSADSVSRLITSLADKLKRDLTTKYIYVNPRSPASYYALFQKKNDVMYFDTEDHADSRAFAAVATAYDTYYPMAPYAPFLKDMALKSIARKRQAVAFAQQINQFDSVKTVDFPELTLKNASGKEVSLSHIATSGKTVLLSFTAYSAEWSPALVNKMRALYDKYHDQGLEIYEVSLDNDSYYWQNASRNLPWICVYDSDGKSLKNYNVGQLPVFFRIKNGELKAIADPAQAMM